MEIDKSVGEKLMKLIGETQWWSDADSDDITFCGSECDNTGCFRHPSNCKHLNWPHSVGLFFGTEYCPLTSLGRGHEDNTGKEE